MESRFDPRWRWPLAAVAAGLFGLMLADELINNGEPFTLWSLISEVLDMGLLIGCTVTTALLLLRTQSQAAESRILREEMRAVQVENGHWRKEMEDHLQGFGAAIQKQFDDWRLSKAEQEVGLLLLKGFSHKEIARIRHTGETTIRQQAGSVYQKAGINGRAALSAYFLDGLHLPDPRPNGEAPPRRAALDEAGFGRR